WSTRPGWISSRSAFRTPGSPPCSGTCRGGWPLSLADGGRQLAYVPRVAGGSDSPKTLRNPFRGSSAELPRVPPMLVRLLSADEPGIPSFRPWLEGFDAVRIFRGPNGVRVRGRTVEVAIDDPCASADHAPLR